MRNTKIEHKRINGVDHTKVLYDSPGPGANILRENRENIEFVEQVLQDIRNNLHVGEADLNKAIEIIQNL